MLRFSGLGLSATLARLLPLGLAERKARATHLGSIALWLAPLIRTPYILWLALSITLAHSHIVVPTGRLVRTWRLGITLSVARTTPKELAVLQARAAYSGSSCDRARVYIKARIPAKARSFSMEPTSMPARSSSLEPTFREART